jgi:hypothetical protein
MYAAGANPLYAVGTDRSGPWYKIAGAPRTSVVIDDGVNLIVSNTWDYGGQPFYITQLSNPTVWTHMPSPSIGRGAYQFAYDKSHHIVYAACMGAGLWRLVSR